jgi:hypothetical protein
MVARLLPSRLAVAAVVLAAAGCKPGLLADEDTGIGAIPGCTPDPTVDCSGGGDGFTCPASDNPEIVGPGLSCSEPVIDPGGNDTYCCFQWTHGTSSCTPDDDLTAACSAGSFGYQCVAATDDPTSLDPSLTCSAPEADFDGRDTDFCCSH